MRYPPAGAPSSEANEEVAQAIPPSDDSLTSIPPLLFLKVIITTLNLHLLESQAIIVPCYSTITDQRPCHQNYTPPKSRTDDVSSWFTHSPIRIQNQPNPY